MSVVARCLSCVLLLSSLFAGGYASAAVADDPALITEDELSIPTRVVTLGTGTPNIIDGRSGTATAVIVDGKEVYLFDAGSGFMSQLGQFREREEKRGVFPSRASYDLPLHPTYLDKLFLTHLDSDHILGLPELLLRGWVLRRNTPVRIWGPQGTRELVDGIVGAYRVDIDHRLQSLPLPEGQPYAGIVEELTGPGVVYRDAYVTISAIAVDHGNWPKGQAFGYRIEAPDKTIVISGDTRPSQDLVEASSGVDLLLHEVMSTTGLARLPEKWQDYMLDAHTTTAQLAEIANTLEPEQLILIHPLFFGVNDQTVIDEMAEHYDGNFTLAQDGDVFE